MVTMEFKSHLLRLIKLKLMNLNVLFCFLNSKSAYFIWMDYGWKGKVVETAPPGGNRQLSKHNATSEDVKMAWTREIAVPV